MPYSYVLRSCSPDPAGRPSTLPRSLLIETLHDGDDTCLSGGCSLVRAPLGTGRSSSSKKAE